MMKVQRADAPVVAADGARPSGIRDEDLLDPPTALGDSLGAALQAPVSAARATAETRSTVTMAVEHDQLGLSGHLPQSLGLPCLDPKLAKPISDRPLATADLHRNLSDRQATRHEIL